MNNPRWLQFSILAAALLAIGSAYLGYTSVFAVLKSLTTVLLIAYFLWPPRQCSARLTAVVFIALCFCLLGDILLLDSARFVFGLAAFLVGHLLFIAAYLLHIGWQPHWKSLAVIAGLGALFYAYQLPFLGGFAVPVALYSLVILSMAWFGYSVYFAAPSKTTLQLALGATVFIVSDSLISINKFVAPFELSTALILSTYWLAVYLLADGFKRLEQPL